MRRAIAAVLVLSTLPGAAGRPVVPPAARAEDAVRDVERGVADLERADRDRRALREQTQRVPQRPDLGYDVRSGIQQKNLRRALPR
jgi:hypothetical protein